MRDAIKPTIVIRRTNAAIYDQGITYNETGLTYNEVGYAYGGLYEHPIAPIIAMNTSVKPRIASLRDYSGRATIPVTLGRGMLMGVMGLTYPEEITVQS